MTLATAKFRMTPDLYRQQHSDWTSAVSRWAKWAPHFSIGLSCVGVALLVVRPDFIPGAFRVGVLFTLLGPIDYAWHLWGVRKWMKMANSSKVAGQSVEVRFDEDAVYMKGPTSESRTAWNGYHRATASSKGLFLYTDKGVHIYVPDYALDVPSAKQQIIERLRTAQ